jgi:hypothetical protein
LVPVNHDYECGRCKTLFEALVEVEQRRIPCPRCKGVADRVYLRMSAMPGKSKGVFPAFDIQSGQTFQSSKDRDDYAYKRGRFAHREGPKFEMQGPEEWERSRHAPKTVNPADTDEVEPWMIETAKRVWDDVKYDRVPKEVEKDRALDAIKESDYLDVKDAPVKTGA